MGKIGRLKGIVEQEPLEKCLARGCDGRVEALVREWDGEIRKCYHCLKCNRIFTLDGICQVCGCGKDGYSIRRMRTGDAIRDGGFYTGPIDCPLV